MPRQPQRIVHQPDAPLVPSLHMLGWNSARAALDTLLPPHIHTEHYEICYIARGEVEWWAGRRTYEVGPGQVYITKPAEAHGGVHAVIQPCDFYWLQVAPPRDSLLGRRLKAMRLRHFAASSHIQACFGRLMEEHARRDALSATAAAAALDDLLVTMLRDHDAARRQAAQREADRSPQIRAALAWMTDRLDEDYPVAEAAAVARLSTTQFHDRFRREIGHTPADWRTRQRIRQAKALLRESDASITDIAMRTGFTTSQYFATTFKNMVGLTPRAYRAAVAAGGYRAGTMR